MAVTIRDVEHVATLARLSFSEEQKRKLTKELNEILSYMEQLNQVDTTAVSPLAQVIELNNVFRGDELKPGLTQQQALQNAPSRTREFFRVPKVIADR